MLSVTRHELDPGAALLFAPENTPTAFGQGGLLPVALKGLGLGKVRHWEAPACERKVK